jgi:hypothetical protein
MLSRYPDIDFWVFLVFSLLYQLCFIFGLPAVPWSKPIFFLYYISVVVFFIVEEFGELGEYTIMAGIFVLYDFFD